MMRLVDADMFDEALKQAQNECKRNGGNFRFGILAQVRANLEKMPTVDALPVVRCKDCKWHTKESFLWATLDFCNRYKELYNDQQKIVPDGFYCGYGTERGKEE